MRKFYLSLILFLAISVFDSAASAQGLLVKPGKDSSFFPVKSNNITAIVGAFQLEVELLKNKIQDIKEQRIEGIPFYTGKLNGQPIVLTRSGIGKVNAALTTALLLEHFRPKQLLFTGIAGAMNPTLHPGDIVVGKLLAHHDYGRRMPEGMMRVPTKNPYYFADNPIFFPSDSLLVVVSQTAAKDIQLQSIGDYKPQIITGTIITGDIFLADTKLNQQLQKEYNSDAVEMEGAAVAQICYQEKVPFIIIRSLSDSADDSAALDFKKYGKVAAENSAMFILEILKLLKK
ncbi:MAG: 5-methylthioadenosine/S-adenosylhomocysteine nucleosidase [Segetibacter sp.]|nr:5-methylthioadenosine/S-adenosylhomocysteine nucleosidase [Segetibacter sp.]